MRPKFEKEKSEISNSRKGTAINIIPMRSSVNNKTNNERVEGEKNEEKPNKRIKQNK